MTFTHLDAAGHARMVDVTLKQPTVRSATARGFVRCASEVVAALRDGTTPKGDVLAVARISGDHHWRSRSNDSSSRRVGLPVSIPIAMRYHSSCPRPNPRKARPSLSRSRVAIDAAISAGCR